MRTRVFIGQVCFLLTVNLAVSQVYAYPRNVFSAKERNGWLKQLGASKDPGAADYHFSLQHDGLTRKYNVHLPGGYDKNTATPMVIFIHGGGGSIKGAYRDGLDKAADKFGFILVVPAGTGPIPDHLLTWNGGEWKTSDGRTDSCCGQAVKNNIDDVGFISKMIDEVEKNFNVDKKRIFVTGISNGAVMSYRLACELSDKIAAVAPVATVGTPYRCKPLRAVSIMHIHGTKDPCAPYDGGIGGGCLGKERRYSLSAAEVVDQWRKIDRCSTESVVSYKKGKATCVSYKKCSGGAEVEFCTVEGGGHTWPSGSQYLPADKVGPVYYDISFDQIWEFFERHPR